VNHDPDSGGFSPLIRRWLRFNAVGAMGIFVQLFALTVFVGLFHINYLTATALAVELAVLHNFVWHERWTWLDRTLCFQGLKLVFARLLHFNLSNGLISLVFNLLSMRLLVGYIHMGYLPANMLAIGSCGIANFLMSEFVVFRVSRE
jgi:putative flippase GtrA